MFNKFSKRAAQVFVAAQDEARALGHSYVGTEHLLLGVMKSANGEAYNVLREHGLDYASLKQEIIAVVGAGIPRENVSSPQMTPRARKIIELAYEEAQLLGQNYISTEHILLAILREGEGVAAHVLRKFGIDLVDLRRELIDEMGGASQNNEDSDDDDFTRPNPSQDVMRSVKNLEGLGVDLTEEAKNGKLDPVIGREREIERIMQILTRRKKNNPVLIGDPGVGKTAIVEGLAQRISSGDVPELLRGKVIFSLDIAALIAGTKYRGEFEKRLKKVIGTVKDDHSIILFVDEVHTIVGAGAAEGAVDAANILKPALSRGELQMIGSTTPDEYRQFIEKDAALERRFQKIYVGEPTTDQTLEILKGLKSKYEIHHKVRYTNDALDLAVKLSQRYITDHYLPDKAIDLIDEAGASARLNSMTVPDEIKELERKIKTVQEEKELSIAQQNYDRAAEVRFKERDLQQLLNDKYNEWKKRRETEIITVDSDSIAKTISIWTGIPLTKLEKTESDRLLKLEEELHRRIVAQEEAIKAVSSAIRRARSGLKDPRRPMGSFMFLGPTGVGKTELAKALAEYLFGDENALVRIDMSEYMERFSVSRLVGAPPGYVGYEEGGTLTEKIRRKPFSVVLLDEIEKAHPDVFNLLLQILDDGRLTDSQGHIVDFKNTILIMTSNLGGEFINKTKRGLGFVEESSDANYESMKSIVMDEVKRTFRPEFLNRLDEIIVFHPLSKAHIEKIIDILLGDLKKRLSERSIKILVSDQAKELVISKGFDPIYGARPLKREIQKMIEDPLSEDLLSDRFEDGDTIVIGASSGKIVFKRKRERKVALSEPGQK
ncbi:MAG: ATP-dependent Clp protease ATP-binding subunit [Athalassotoga sp.]